MSTWSLAALRRKVERLAAERVAASCSGQHERFQICHLRDGEPAPVWPTAQDPARCACGAAMRYALIVHRHMP
jgi:hypothetical protein